ncbi:hypothetical protein K490DRAFT_65506 [Saccharata proteae CBS 121410]|uniref:Uncharacterized protein n=1 Tax=Saccharata proteae CBS 121410 TaxID=1314787 RepID=A0A9P4HX62_9PEZI|nr:hypothetical protein K490DRAFT_65506 [Saccharata proteae CBS 121410]
MAPFIKTTDLHESPQSEEPVKPNELVQPDEPVQLDEPIQTEDSDSDWSVSTDKIGPLYADVYDSNGSLVIDNGDNSTGASDVEGTTTSATSESVEESKPVKSESATSKPVTSKSVAESCTKLDEQKRRKKAEAMRQMRNKFKICVNRLSFNDPAMKMVAEHIHKEDPGNCNMRGDYLQVDYYRIADSTIEILTWKLQKMGVMKK